MAYRIFFSGLMAFVERGGFKEVDVLLLNPCASQHHPGEGEHEGADHERSCLDRHLPQLTVKAADMAEWNLAGTLHGCGSRHFDLTGQIIVPKGSKGAIDFKWNPALDTYPVDSFGDMRHVSFEKGIVDMRRVLGGDQGKIDYKEVKGLLKGIGKKLIAARVRLPKGRLTALAPLDNSVRQVAKWNIGLQKDILVMCETVMFEPGNRKENRINVGKDGFVVLKSKPDVAVWITSEPRVKNRFNPAGRFPGVKHFEHYYDLLPAVKDAPTSSPKVMRQHPEEETSQPLKKAKGPVPELDKASFNIDTPPCPECLMHTDNPLGS